MTTERVFRWQALFQQVNEPLFVLNRERRLLFVNRAWEALTGVPAAEARGWVCTERGTAVGRALAPPLEVLEGKPGRARRRLPNVAAGASPWWDVEFFPLRGLDGLLCIVGKITGAALAPSAEFVPLAEALRDLRDKLARELPKEEAAELWDPEKLVSLRERLVDQFRLDQLDDSLPSMRRITEQVRLASLRVEPGGIASVFIVGEAGAGKHWLARAIHHHGPGRELAFAALDCAHLPPVALADVLFGDTGLWWRAGIGTIYLKEPSRLPHDLQARLRDEIEEGRVTAVAASREAKVPARPQLISGSICNPRDEVLAGGLLDKLHAVLTTLVIEVPPLRERLADLPNLVDVQLARLNAGSERRLNGLTAAAWDLIREHRWPGNLRELHAVLKGCHARAGGERIDAADLPAYLRQAVLLERTPTAAPERPMPLDRLLEEAERRLIEVALQRARGNKSRAAELLAVWRPRLFRRMEALGIKENPKSENSNPK
jgi:DNA-binding NtrC family response regulator